MSIYINWLKINIKMVVKKAPGTISGAFFVYLLIVFSQNDQNWFFHIILSTGLIVRPLYLALPFLL